MTQEIKKRDKIIMELIDKNTDSVTQNQSKDQDNAYEILLENYQEIRRKLEQQKEESHDLNQTISTLERENQQLKDELSR